MRATYAVLLSDVQCRYKCKMQDRFKNAAGRKSTGGLGTWGIHDDSRTVAGSTLESGGLALMTIDDDAAADIIKRMVPAIEHSLHLPDGRRSG